MIDVLDVNIINQEKIVNIDISSDDVEITLDIEEEKNELEVDISNESGEPTTATDYNDLINKPKINNIELKNNKSLNELQIQSKMEALSNFDIQNMFK